MREERAEQVGRVAAERVPRIPRPVQWAPELGARVASSHSHGTSPAGALRACCPGLVRTQGQEEQREERGTVQPPS